MRLLGGAVIVAVLALLGCAPDDVTDPGGRPEPVPVVATDAATGTGTSAASEPPTRQSEPPVTQVPIQSAAGVPSAATQSPPVRVTVPALGADVPVDPVGVAADDQMEIPPDAARAGWYRYGPSVGAAEGTTVLAAHSGSHITALGPLRDLVDLVPGDTIDVTRADGETFRYAVETSQLIPKTTIDLSEHFRREGDHRLVLITCDGVWRDDVQSYTDNTVVTATLVTS